MRIRTVLIGIGLAGNLLLALSLFFLFNYRDTTQKSFANESLVSTYEAAWFQTLETSIDAISAWLPVTGEEEIFGILKTQYIRKKSCLLPTTLLQIL